MLKGSIRGIAALAISAVAGLPEPAVAGIQIDSFDGPSSGQVAADLTPNGKPAVEILSGQDAIGGSREIFANKVPPAGGNGAVTASANQFGSGIFSFDQFSSTARGSARLVYDGTADGLMNTTGLSVGGAGIDLTEGGANTGLLFSDLSVIGSGLTLTANIYNSVSGEVFTSGPVALVNGFSGFLFIEFAGFSGAGGNLTPGSAGALELWIHGTSPGSDLMFGSLASAPHPDTPESPEAPEPGTLFLAGLGGVGMLLGARRRARGGLAAPGRRTPGAPPTDRD